MDRESLDPNKEGKLVQVIVDKRKSPREYFFYKKDEKDRTKTSELRLKEFLEVVSFVSGEKDEIERHKEFNKVIEEMASPNANGYVIGIDQYEEVGEDNLIGHVGVMYGVFESIKE